MIDAIIAGAGLAGASVAAALTELGWKILVVEPGLDASKRLSGELIHPPGVMALAELGLWKNLEHAGGCRCVVLPCFPGVSGSKWDGRDRPKTLRRQFQEWYSYATAGLPTKNRLHTAHFSGVNFKPQTANPNPNPQTPKPPNPKPPNPRTARVFSSLPETTQPIDPPF
jgi:hypothetical protein